MRSVSYYCDRCKRKYEKDEKENNNRDYYITDFQDDKLDICPSCYVKFKWWFMEGDGDN